MIVSLIFGLSNSLLNLSPYLLLPFQSSGVRVDCFNQPLKSCVCFFLTPFHVSLWHDEAECCRCHRGQYFVVVDFFVNHLVQFELRSMKPLPMLTPLLDQTYSMNRNCPSIRNWTSCVQYCRGNALFARDTVRHHQNYKSTLYTNNHHHVYNLFAFGLIRFESFLYIQLVFFFNFFFDAKKNQNQNINCQFDFSI